MVFTPAPPSSPQADFRALLEASYERRNLIHIAAGSTVPLLRKSVWLVVRGMVKLTALSINGDEMLLGLAGPNEPFGDPLSNVEAYEATTLCDTDLLCLTCDEISREPHLAMALLQGMGVRYRQSESMLALLGLRRVEDRVRGFLELLANDYGQPCEEGLRLDIKLTHQELASALSTTRVTVTRVLGVLRDEGWLQIDGKRRLVISHLPASTARVRCA